MPLMAGMNGWKAMLEGEKIDRKTWKPGFFERILDRIFGGKMLELKTSEGRDIWIRRTDVFFIEHQVPKPAIEQPPPPPPGKGGPKPRIPGRNLWKPGDPQ